MVAQCATLHHHATMKAAKSSVVLCLLATLAVCTVSCRRTAKFSTVLEGGFDPVAAFRQHGYIIQSEARGEGIRNEANGYAWQSWCGVTTRTQSQAGTEAVAFLIRDELNRALSGDVLDELTGRAGPSEAQPLTGMLRYNKDHVHGDLHAWLMPVASNAVSYVIFVREEQLK